MVRVFYFQLLWQLRIKWICIILSLLQFGHEVGVNAPSVLFAAAPPVCEAGILPLAACSKYGHGQCVNNPPL